LTLFREHPDLECFTIPELLGFYAVHKSNLTSRRWLMPLWAYRVFRSHGMSRLASSASLIPWTLSQAAAQWRCNQKPLSLSLQTALSAEPPRTLPPR
jgi:hypothetical protein